MNDVTEIHDPMACPCGMTPRPREDQPRPYSKDWHIIHRLKHIAAFPDLDQASLRNLDEAVDRADGW